MHLRMLYMRVPLKGYPNGACVRTCVRVAKATHAGARALYAGPRKDFEGLQPNITIN
jgi:hypothetical protein